MPKQTAAQRAQAEMETVKETIVAELGGKKVKILPMEDWPASGRRAFGESRYDEWAEKCLVNGDYAIWREVDPSLKQLGPFFASWETQTGQDMGESEASQGS